MQMHPEQMIKILEPQPLATGVAYKKTVYRYIHIPFGYMLTKR